MSYSTSSHFSPTDPLRFREVEDERRDNLSPTASYSSQTPSYQSPVFTSSSSEFQDEVGPSSNLGGLAGRQIRNSYRRTEDEDNICVRPVINFDPTFNPRKYLYNDDCDVDNILRKIRGEKEEPMTSSNSPYFSPTDPLVFREVDDERPDNNISSTASYSSQLPSYCSTSPSSQIPSYSPPSSSHFPSHTSSSDNRVDCPICGVAFHQDIIERHAATCFSES